MLEVTSFSNPKFKQLKSLAKSRNRKKDRLFLSEGRVELEMAAHVGHKPELIAFCKAYVSLEEISGLFSLEAVSVLSLSKELFDDLTYQNVPGNFIAIFESWTGKLESIERGTTVVVLEGVEKPGNLGAILRTCDAVGVQTVIVTESQIDVFNPNVIRNSRGAVFTINVVLVANKNVLQFAKANGYSIFAAALTKDAVDYKSTKPTDGKMYVFGAESTGLSRFWLENSDQRIVIPMRGSVDSLNLSVSLAVILFNG